MTGDLVRCRPIATPQSFRTSSLDLWSPDECNQILTSFSEGDWAPIDQHRDGASFRSVEIQRAGIDMGEVLFDRMLRGFEAANSSVFRFDLSGVAAFDPPQALRYQPGQGHYGWHMDASENAPLRKLSLVVLLNDPGEFEGGDLEFKGWGRHQLEPGRAVVFPSYFWHRVHPVTAGVRVVVVAWCQGPTFR